MNRRIVVLLLLMAGFASIAVSQVAIPDRRGGTGFREEVMGLGFFAGPTSGLGVSFRHHLRIPFSYQITAGIIKVDDRLLYDFGGEVQYDLSRGEGSRFFVVGGLGYYYAGRSSHNDIDAPARLGFGAGAEVGISPAIGATLELLFTIFTDGTILPLPQAGIFYYF
jgi:hypothetical protein